MARRSDEVSKMAPLLSGLSGSPSEDSFSGDLLALIESLNAHKIGDDHDGRYSLLAHLHDDRYYTESEITTFLSYKADKTLTLTAGNGLTGGGDLSANRTFAVGAGTGITVNTDDIQIKLSENLDWTGLHTFSQYLSTASIYPTISDTSDLGDYNRLWRKIWGSELSAIVFAKYEQVLMGGWFTVSKGEGILPTALSASATQYDFPGNTFANNDILVFRGISANNTPQVEYIKVNWVSVNTFQLTRNLDGTGANDWPIGTVYANFGSVGDGRVELYAYGTPRMSIYSHGSTYNDQKEQVRIGDLNGQWGYGAKLYGAAFGSYETGKANITIDPTNGIRIRNYNVDVIKLTGTVASFENVIVLGAAGRLQQGTGTWGSTFTGSAIWNESGVMNIGGWNAGVKQWWGGSDGILYAAAGQITLGIDGIKFKYNPTGISTLLFQGPDLTYRTGIVMNVENYLEIHSDIVGAGLVFSIKQTDGTYPYMHFWEAFTNKPQLDVRGSVWALNGFETAGQTKTNSLSVGATSTPTAGSLSVQLDATVSRLLMATSLHVGGTENPGANNMVVNGTLSVYGNTTLTGTLSVGGLTTLSDNLVLSGAAGILYSGASLSDYKYVHNSSNAGATWFRLAIISLGAGTYKGANFVVALVHGNGNWGQAQPSVHNFKINMVRSGTVQDDTNSATVTGTSTDYIRVVKTANGVFEIQMRAIVNYQIVTTHIHPVGSSGASAVYGFAAAGTGTIYSSTLSGDGYWQNWTPTETGWTVLPTGDYRYCRVGNMVTCAVSMTAGTSDSTVATLTLPFTAKTLTGHAWGGANFYAMDSGTALTVASRWHIVSGGTVVNFYKDMYTGVWTASGTKRVYATFTYEAEP